LITTPGAAGRAARGDRSGRGVRHGHDAEALANSRSPLGTKEREVVVDHLSARIGRADEHHVARLDAIEDEHGQQVAVLERWDPIDVVGQQRLTHAVRRQGDQDVIAAPAGVVQCEHVPQPPLDLPEILHPAPSTPAESAM
jgi:hypothetical protein